MNRVPAWFERRFEFTFPVEQYPNVCVRLRGTPARLDELLRGVPHEVLIAKPENKWSAQEHAGHLLDFEPLWITRVEDFFNEGANLTPADLTNRKTDEAQHNAHSLEDILRDFRIARIGFVERVTSIEARDSARTLLHPRLKTPMRLVDHLYFVAEHDDHHLARIWELIDGKE